MQVAKSGIINKNTAARKISRISKKIQSTMGFVSEGRSLTILKNTKPVALVIFGKFYQYNITDLLTDILNEIMEIYKD